MINVKVIENKSEGNKKYPKLKKFTSSSRETIVLFNAKNAGVCISTTAPSEFEAVGMFRVDWSEFNFEDFYGSVTISSED